MLDPALRAIADYGLALVIVVALSIFTAWLIRAWLTDLRATRDRALDISERQIDATKELTLAVRDLTEVVKRRRT